MEDVNSALLLIAAIVEEQGGQVTVSERARNAVTGKALEVYVNEDNELVVGLVDPEDLEDE